MEKDKEPNYSLVDTLIALAKTSKPLARVVFRATQSALDKIEKRERRRELRQERFTRKGDRRSIESVAKGISTRQKNRRKRSRLRTNERRTIQNANFNERCFHRELSATAIMLKAMDPGRAYLRSEIRAACPELPEGSICALLGKTLIKRGLLERCPNPNWDGIQGSLRAKGADVDAERRSRWRYRLTAAGEAARAEILDSPTKWTAVERWKVGLENARAVPQPHSRAAWPEVYRP